MSDAKTVRVEFRGDGSERLTGQYDSVIRKDKELEQQLGQAGQASGAAADAMEGLNESLDGFSERGSVATGIGKGLALGLGALGSLATQAVIEGITWAIDEFNKSANQGRDYLDKFKGKAEEMATALLSVENAAGLAITKLNEFNVLRAQDSLSKAGEVTRGDFRGFAGKFMQMDAKLGGAYPEVTAAAELARKVAAAPALDLTAIKAFTAELEAMGSTANAAWRDELEPMRKSLLELRAATEGTTPKIVTQAEVTDKLNAAYQRSTELQRQGADAAAIARAGDAAYAKGKAEAAQITGITADEVERLAQIERQRGEELARLTIAQREANKETKDAAKEAKELAKAEDEIRKAKSARLRLESDERVLAEKMTNNAMKPIYKDLADKDRDEAAAFEARIDLAQKEADAQARIWEGHRQDERDAWSDFWFDVFGRGKVSFGGLLDSMGSLWARQLADMMAGTMSGGGLGGGMGGGSPFGGAAGALGAISKLFGGDGGGSKGGSQWAGAFDGADSSVSDSMGGLAGGGIMGMAGGALAGAGMGGGIGKMLGSGTGGSIGGAIGSLYGPIGSLVGSVIGGLIGGLMKSTPKSISSYGSGGVIDSMASGGLDVKIGKDMASAVVRALRTFSEQLVTGLEDDAFFGIVGQRGSKFFFQAQKTDLKVAGKKKYGAEKFDTAEEAISAAIEAAINSGFVKGLTDADKRLMRAATSVEQAMADVVSSHNFKRELEFQFIGLSSPQGEAMARLEFEYQQQLILAEKYEADKTQLEAVYAQKRIDLQKQYQEQLYGGLKDYLVSITGGSASPLSATSRLSLSQARYNDLATRAKAGDKDAIGALQGAAQDYLGASQAVFGSSGGYFASYNRVVGDISGITGMANPLGAANQNVAAAVNDNSRLQALAAERAFNQRQETNTQLARLVEQNAVLMAALQRGAAGATQNGVGVAGALPGIDLQALVAGIRW